MSIQTYRYRIMLPLLTIRRFHRRVPVSTTRLPAKVANTARPTKGDRGAHMIRNHPAVTQRLVTLASAAGSSSVSQYAADLLAVRVGLPEHVRKLDSDTEHRKPTGRPAGRLTPPHHDSAASPGLGTARTTNRPKWFRPWPTGVLCRWHRCRTCRTGLPVVAECLEFVPG